MSVGIFSQVIVTQGCVSEVSCVNQCRRLGRQRRNALNSDIPYMSNFHTVCLRVLAYSFQWSVSTSGLPNIGGVTKDTVISTESMVFWKFGLCEGEKTNKLIKIYIRSTSKCTREENEARIRWLAPGGLAVQWWLLVNSVPHTQMYLSLYNQWWALPCCMNVSYGDKHQIAQIGHQWWPIKQFLPSLVNQWHNWITYRGMDGQLQEHG